MIFKQDVLREEKIKFGLYLAVDCIPVLLLILAALNGENLLAIAVLLAISVVFVFIPGLILALLGLERYYIYEDRIEVRCPLGKKNTVLFKKVQFVEETEISLTTRGAIKTFYIFNDGRKNNGSIIDYNSCYNNRKYNFRIYKTDELEKFITNTLDMEIRKNAKQ